MSNEQDDRWYVQLDSEEVRLMTLEQLDEAFQQGLVHENTYVIQVGETKWVTLGEVAGLGDEEEEEEAVATPNPRGPVAAPHAVQAAPARFAAPAPSASPRTMTQAHPAQSQQMLPQQMQPRPTAPASAWPPVASAAPPSGSFGPSNSSGHVSVTPRSMIPVVQDVPSLDFDEAAFKPRKTKLFVGIAATLAALGAGAFALTRLDASPTAAHVPVPEAAPVAAAAANPARPSSFDTPSTPAPSPQPATPTTTSSDTTSSAQAAEADGNAPRLTEDMKKALLAQDTERASAKKNRSRPVAKRSGGGKADGSGPFRSGGNTHDPLNGNL